MTIKYDDRLRTQQEVDGLFNFKFLDRLITQLAVSKVEAKICEIGTVDDRSRFESPKINEDAK